MMQSTIVVFVCPNCDRLFRARQQRLLTAALGKFECLDCETVVYEWGGRYHYTDWRIEPLTGLRAKK